jgi:hypothetical protein
MVKYAAAFMQNWQQLQSQSPAWFLSLKEKLLALKGSGVKASR